MNQDGLLIIFLALMAAMSIAVVQPSINLQISSLPTVADFLTPIWGNNAITSARILPSVSESIATNQENLSINDANEMVELTFSKDYPSSPWPIEQQYVRYDLQLRYLGTGELKNQVLWTRFTSESGKTSHESAFAIPKLHADETIVLHVGPFKMHDSSDHMLFVGMNSLGDNGIRNEVNILNASPSMALDSFHVFSNHTVERLMVGFILLVLGFGVMAIYVVIRTIRKTHIRKVTRRDNGNNVEAGKNNNVRI